MRQVLYQDEEENRLSKMIPKSIPMLEAAPCKLIKFWDANQSYRGQNPQLPEAKRLFSI